jgi:hypothetical protein
MKKHTTKYLLNSVEETKALRSFCKAKGIPCSSNNAHQWVKVDTKWSEVVDAFVDINCAFSKQN